MDESRWLSLTLFLGLIAVVFIVGNPVACWQARRRGRGYSSVPFIGGVAGAGACLCCPVHGVGYFAWVPLLLDVTIVRFVAFLVGVVRQGR